MAFEDIHNFYEKLVLNYLQENLMQNQGIRDVDLLEDIACVALNNLPPRYVRHAVDTAFYLSPEDAADMQRQIATAVQNAQNFINKRGGARS